MELLHDSALEAGAAVRGAGDPGRLLSFGRGDLIVELEVGAGAVTGQVLPAQDATRDAAAHRCRGPHGRGRRRRASSGSRRSGPGRSGSW